MIFSFINKVNEEKETKKGIFFAQEFRMSRADHGTLDLCKSSKAWKKM
jgi:hypothetical protein